MQKKKNNLKMFDSCIQTYSLNGTTLTTIYYRGRIVWAHGKLQTVPGSGKFIPLLANSPFVFSTHEKREQKIQPRIVERLE